MRTLATIYSSFQKKKEKIWISVYAFHFICETQTRICSIGNRKNMNVFDNNSMAHHQ